MKAKKQNSLAVGCEWRECVSCEERKFITEKHCARIFYGFRFAFPYLLRCELNELLQHTANVSHQLHSCAYEGEKFYTFFLLSLSCEHHAMLGGCFKVTLNYGLIVMENGFHFFWMRGVTTAFKYVTVPRRAKMKSLQWGVIDAFN